MHRQVYRVRGRVELLPSKRTPSSGLEDSATFSPGGEKAGRDGVRYHAKVKQELKTNQARQLRQDATPPERMLWNRLRARQLAGLRFRRQQPIGPYIADFYCADARLVIELDGKLHDRAHDAARDAWMQAEGLAVLRFSCDELPGNLEGVLRTIRRDAEWRIQERNRGSGYPFGPGST